MIKNIILIICLSILSITIVNADENVALVNSKPITKSELMFIKKNQGNNYNETLAIDNLVRMKLLAQEAIRMNVNKQADYSTRKDLAELNMLSNLMVSEKLKNFKPTEEDFKKEYGLLQSELGDKEYSVRQMIVDNESDANDIIKQLNNGADFKKLAKEKSKELATKDNGGLINGWLNKSSTAKNFHDVLFNLQKGKYSTTPIKSNFGYHVIYIEDVRAITLPPYEKMKPNLYNRMTAREVNKFVGALKDKAKIEIVSSQKSK
jgi:peptidyl-prolyl cis-trans isomerase C